MGVRIKRPTNITLNENLYKALDLYCTERRVLKSELIALLLLYFFSNQSEISDEMKKLISEISKEEIFSQFSPIESYTLKIPALKSMWKEIRIKQK